MITSSRGPESPTNLERGRQAVRLTTTYSLVSDARPEASAEPYATQSMPAVSYAQPRCCRRLCQLLRAPNLNTVQRPDMTVEGVGHDRVVRAVTVRRSAEVQVLQSPGVRHPVGLQRGFDTGLVDLDHEVAVVVGGQDR